MIKIIQKNKVDLDVMIDVVIATKKLIADSSRWTKTVHAGRDGIPCHDSNEAKRWCVIGAMCVSLDNLSVEDDHKKTVIMVLATLFNETVMDYFPYFGWGESDQPNVQFNRTIQFNDHPETTHKSVMLVLDRLHHRLLMLNRSKRNIIRKFIKKQMVRKILHFEVLNKN